MVEQATINEEMNVEIEGLDQAQSQSWGDYPLDTVFVRKETRTVLEIVNRIRKQRYKLDPEFQRDFVWSPQQQARLIESSLMRIPLPVLYVAEDTDGRIIVVDGLQRLTTFYQYLDDEFTLKSIDGNNPDSLINDKKFSQLPIHLQERIEDTQLTLYILDPKAPERARLDIFERVNSGVPLTRQQMRNCMYSGPATAWLKKAAASKDFLQATGESIKVKSMRDREVINRFCAFYINGYEQYKGDMDEFLALALRKMNQMDEAQLDQMFVAFAASMQLNFELFGRHAFRKSLVINEDNAKKSVLNISLFDALATVMAKNSTILKSKAPEEIILRITTLLKYQTFSDSISLSTNNLLPVRCRHGLLEMALIRHFNVNIIQIIFNDLLTNQLHSPGFEGDEGGVFDLAVALCELMMNRDNNINIENKPNLIVKSHCSDFIELFNNSGLDEFRSSSVQLKLIRKMFKINS